MPSFTIRCAKSDRGDNQRHIDSTDNHSNRGHPCSGNRKDSYLESGPCCTNPIDNHHPDIIGMAIQSDDCSYMYDILKTRKQYKDKLLNTNYCTCTDNGEILVTDRSRVVCHFNYSTCIFRSNKGAGLDALQA